MHMDPLKDSHFDIKKNHLEVETIWWRVLIDQSRDGVVVLGIDGSVHSVNQKFADMLGYTKEELLQRHIWDWNTIQTPEELLTMLNMADENVLNFQTVHQRKDGSTFDVEITANVAIYNNEKTVICVCRNITEQKKAEQALRESEERFRTLVNHAADAFTLIDEQGQIIDANQVACESLGYSREEMLRLYIYDIDVKAKLSDHKENYWKRLTPEIKLRFESQHRRKDGSFFPVEVNLGLVELAGRRLMLGLARDISERKRLEQQLRQAQKMEAVGQLAGGIAHDFNNMLGVIIGGVEMIMDQVDTSNPPFTNLRTIRKAAERSAELTRQLLAFARKQMVVPKVLDLNQTVEGMLKMLRRLIGEDINLTWQPAPNIPAVKIDPTQIDQILANLCVNARHAIASVGNLTIETGVTTLDEAYCAGYTGLQPGEYVMLNISDDGHGMDKKVQEKIFEPFFTTKEMGKGTGLGLATVYGIVKQNNGTITVDSEPGLGSTFKIYLPVYNPQKYQQAEPLPDQLLEKGNETILLVEDEFTMMNMGRNLLEKLGYNVLAATTPTTALSLAEEHAGEIHLLLCDIVLPEMNGRDLACKIETLQPGLKILFMSGYTPSDMSRQGIVPEKINFIQKPFSMQALAVKVRAVLDGL